MELTFSFLQLIVNGKIPSSAILREGWAHGGSQYQVDDSFYMVQKENIEDRYFWLYMKYGKSNPYADTVYNTNKSELEENPRKKEQVEMANQIFALYTSENRELMVCAKNYKILKSYFFEMFKSEIEMKHFFKDVDAFVDSIKTIDEIKLTQKRNILTTKENIFGADAGYLPDAQGIGYPTAMTLAAKYDAAPISSRDFLKKYLRDMDKKKQSDQLESLVCVGRDEKNIEKIFNMDNIKRKVTINLEKEGSGMYDPAAVKRAVLSQVRCPELETCA